MSTQDNEITAVVKALALGEGFAAVGIASADSTPGAELYRRWIELGCHGGMEYLEKNMPQRFRPDVLVQNARSVICLAVAYAGGEQKLIAKYAQGQDYHKVLKKRCIRLMDRIVGIAPEFAGRAFVDSAPIMERSLAASCGLGCIASNGCLVAEGLGSYVFLCEIVCNLPLTVDPPLEPQKNACNNCGQCLAACPTGAIGVGDMIDARRCISYLTIEHPGPIAPEFWPLMGTHVFGCDACQDACPLNSSPVAGDTEFAARDKITNLKLADILKWTFQDWDEITRGSAMRRASFDMFIRNAIIAASNSTDTLLIEPLQAVRAGHPDFGQMIDWAVNRLNEVDHLGAEVSGNRI